MSTDVQPYGMLMKDNIGMVPPPQIQTVKKTMRRVVENIIWRAYVAVSRIERAKVIAPRRPGGDEQKQSVWETVGVFYLETARVSVDLSWTQEKPQT